MSERRRASVTVHIEQLVIAGLPLAGDQAAQVQRAMERELARLLQSDGIGRASGGAAPELAARAIQFSTPLRPAEVGRQIAHSVHETLTHGL